jgi:predicted RND superfamily exporter protein
MPLRRLTEFALDRPKTVIVVITLATIVFALQFPRVIIDTDPENMLEVDQPDRVFYNQVKEAFGIRDLIVVGIVDDSGIFRAEALERVQRATAEILKIQGVIIEDVVSLTTTDNVKSAGGFLDIRPVMETVPRTAEAIEQLRRDIAENPFLHEKIASADGAAVALYIPIEQKAMSYRVAGEISAILERDLLPGQQYHLAGLPVAEDTFGHEMFVQMAVVAPVAFMAVMALVFLLFRRVAFLVPVGMDAMFSVIWAMGLLIGTGNTVHIMSSMIPVFLMPSAITDDMHILSGFFDRYRALGGDKRRAMLEAMQPIYRPMLFAALVTAAGFASLALADIPPVQVFGLFVAFGCIVDWVFSMTVVPAVVALMSEDRLQRILPRPDAASGPSLLDRVLRHIGHFAFARAKWVLFASALLVVAGVWGIAQIRVNDNPVRWFKASHPMRVADTVMNSLLGGTYMAYLIVEGADDGAIKRPEIMSYIARLQEHLEKQPLIGKTSSAADIVKRINLVLHDNEPAYNVIPDSPEAVGQFLFLFQSSGDPDDLDNFLDRTARRANIWVQMRGGDNQQMQAVEDDLAEFVRVSAPPAGVSLRWSGLTYINKIWQGLMVGGMSGRAIPGSFVVVFLLVVVAFRSLPLGALSMIPMGLAILFAYGLVGWVGKDFDMPIAVCSSIALGMGIDLAIHFLDRFRVHYASHRDLEKSIRHMFDEPGRAIARNAVVIILGFLPLAAASLTPYVTVGVFFALLMVFSTLGTIYILPAVLRVIGPRILRGGVR